ncbi:MAG: hypothetical protein V4695_09005 [Pseudomonadota bacterium]
MTIENMLMRTYADFEKAQEAREALLAAGFPQDSVSFTAREDESGAVTGNFLIDKSQHADTDRPKPNFMEGYDPNETQSATPVDWGRSYVLTVDAPDGSRMQQAAQIVEPFGGIDIDDVTSKASVA